MDIDMMVSGSFCKGYEAVRELSRGLRASPKSPPCMSMGTAQGDRVCEVCEPLEKTSCARA